ncbi:FIST C-terminal domain-containing protein [Cyanobium sp. FGCU-52]|nr:FIST C-terminal domain-containing protein [Cyanobium sp. FGCU52]
MGSSTGVDSTAALEEALAQLELPGQARLLVVMAAPRYDLQVVSDGLQRALPDCPRIGCSSSGEIAPSGALTQALVLWVLGGTGIRVSTGWGASTGEHGLRQAAFEAARCLERLERRAHTVLMLLSDGLGGDQMEVVRGAYDVAHVDVPLVGGCAGDYLAMHRTHQLHGSRLMSGAVVAAAISSDRPLGVGVSHGWTPMSEPMLVTGSKATRLSSLDDRPALQVYLDFFQPPPEVHSDPVAFADFAATHPIGIRRRDKIEMRHITGFDAERGELITVAEVPQGALAFLTEGNIDSVLGAASQSCRSAIEALGGAPAAGLLLFDCVARRSLFEQERMQEETELIRRSSGGVPMGGFYTYGEIGRTKGAGGFHNQTLVTLAIG